MLTGDHLVRLQTETPQLCWFAQVEAEANTDSRPLEGFTPRKGAGIPLFGKSSTYPPPGPVIECMRPAIDGGLWASQCW